MRYDSIQAFADAASRQYLAPGNLRLREKDAYIDDTLNSSFPVDIPEDLAGRAEPLHAGIAREKAFRSDGALTDKQGVQFIVPPSGNSLASEKMRENFESILGGMWRSHVAQSLVDTEHYVTDDEVCHGRGYLRVLWHTAAWSAMTSFTGPKSGGQEWLEQAMEAAGMAEPDDAMRETQRAMDKAHNDAIRRTILPIAITYCPARACIPIEDDFNGLAEMWEFRQFTVRNVLNTFRDEHGEPLAKELAASVEEFENDLTNNDVCTVVMHSDRQDIQIAVLRMMLDNRTEIGRQSFTSHGGDEFIFGGEGQQSEHHMGVVPYASFIGREIPSEEPATRYHGLFDRDTLSLCRAYDRGITQMATNHRANNWTTEYLYHHPDGDPPQTGDKPVAVEKREGGLMTGFGPGDEVRPWPNGTAEGASAGKDYLQLLEYRIDRNTFGDAMYGQGSADSGYDRNLKQSQADSVLLPFKIGKERGFGRVGDLMRRAARALFAQDLPAIQVRIVGDDGAQYLELTPEMAAIEWEIKAEIMPTPVGGEFAHFQTVNAMQQAGYFTKVEALRRMGIRKPEQMMRQIDAEQLAHSPDVMKALVASLVQQTTAALAARQGPSLPQNPVLPQTVAATLGGLPNLDPSISAMLPPGSVPPPGAAGQPPMAGIGGLPNLANTGAAGPPPPAGATGVPSAGGSPFGQAAASPGGAMRQSEIAGRMG